MRRSEHEAREGTGRKRLVGQGYQLEWAEEISQRMVKVERIIDGALLLEVDPEWAGAIKMVLVSKGVRVSELGRSPGYIAAPIRTAELVSEKGVRRRWSRRIPARSKDLHGSS